MVNLIVSHGSHLQGNSLQRTKSPAMVQRHPSPKLRRDPAIPLQIQSVTSRPLVATLHQPQTASDSIFDVGNNLSSFFSSDSSSNYFRDKYSDYRAGSYEQTEPLTCDYDTNVTQLYEMLESSQWEDAIERCHDHPDEVRTWINRRGRWQVLPLHAAIIFQAPKKVIDQILRIHPSACSEKDDQGMLPLHLAFRHKLEEGILDLLTRGYPAGTECKDNRGRSPIEHAKDGQFSGKFTRLYAEASCSEERAQRTVAEASTSVQESQVATFKLMYEQRIDELESKHEQDIYTLRISADQEQAELRDLLSREVASTQKSSLLESEVHELHSSLESANQEIRALRRLLKKQAADQKQLKQKFKLVVSNQQALHELCMQQQEQLKHSRKMREKMLRSLLEKEEGESTIGVSSQICRVSGNIMTSTEQIFSQIVSAREAEGDQANPIEVLPQESQMSNTHMKRSAWQGERQHQDEISAITEISRF